MKISLLKPIEVISYLIMLMMGIFYWLEFLESGVFFSYILQIIMVILSIIAFLRLIEVIGLPWYISPIPLFIFFEYTMGVGFSGPGGEFRESNSYIYLLLMITLSLALISATIWFAEAFKMRKFKRGEFILRLRCDYILNKDKYQILYKVTVAYLLIVMILSLTLTQSGLDFGEERDISKFDNVLGVFKALAYPAMLLMSTISSLSAFTGERTRKLPLLICIAFSLVGMLSGYKAAMVFPLVALFIGKWLAYGREKSIRNDLILLFVLVLASYVVITPLRNIAQVNKNSVASQASQLTDVVKYDFESLHTYFSLLTERFGYAQYATMLLERISSGNASGGHYYISPVDHLILVPQNAFIPRFLNPSKEVVSYGQWFNTEIRGDKQNTSIYYGVTASMLHINNNPFSIILLLPVLVFLLIIRGFAFKYPLIGVVVLFDCVMSYSVSLGVITFAYISVLRYSLVLVVIFICVNSIFKISRCGLR